MASFSFGTLILECVQGDIVRQPDMDAIVNAANAQLLPGGGVAGAIHRAAGPGLAEECRPLAPIRPGDAVITGAHRLSNRYVIHCLGPVYGVDEPSAELLASCYRNALRLAEDHRLSSVAFPAISTGVFGYPMEAAVQVSLDAILAQKGALRSIRRIRFVLFAPEDLAMYETALAKLDAGSGHGIGGSGIGGIAGPGIAGSQIAGSGLT
jgi:O-acetyl-ADP-ribose deacetylase (regulator of RNase III)